MAPSTNGKSVVTSSFFELLLLLLLLFLFFCFFFPSLFCFPLLCFDLVFFLVLVLFCISPWLVLSVASWRSVNLAVFFFIVRMEISLFLWKIFLMKNAVSGAADEICFVVSDARGLIWVISFSTQACCVWSLFGFLCVVCLLGRVWKRCIAL